MRLKPIYILCVWIKIPFFFPLRRFYNKKRAHLQEAAPFFIALIELNDHMLSHARPHKALLTWKVRSCACGSFRETQACRRGPLSIFAVNRPRHAGEATSYKFPSRFIIVPHQSWRKECVALDGSKGPRKLYKKRRGERGVRRAERRGRKFMKNECGEIAGEKAPGVFFP